jgi:hypothetical protein
MRLPAQLLSDSELICISNRRHLLRVEGPLEVAGDGTDNAAEVSNDDDKCAGDQQTV